MATVTLAGSLDFWARRWPDRVAVRSGAEQATWGELLASAEGIAAGLQASGIGAGDAVAILMHNRLAFIEALLAIFKLGARATLLNIRFTPNEIVYPVADAGIRAVFTQPELVDRLSVARAEHPDLLMMTTDGEGGHCTLDQLRAGGGPLAVPAVEEEEVALICYSSGTTGFPKGVMLTHRNIREGGLATAVPCGFGPEDRVLITAPLAYTWGLVQYLREALSTGATATIIDPASGADDVIEVLARDRITMWSGVPVMFERVAASERFAGADLSHLRHAVTGDPSPHLLRQWQDKGVLLSQAYGMTETGGHVTMLFGDEARDRKGSAGRALLGVDLAVADDDGRLLPPGEEGEILVRGPMVMRGYLNNPDETAKAMAGGWLHTGDAGVVDADGYLKVTGRKKDMLRSGGLNVYPAEIERVLAGIAGMEEFAVIGVSDARWGEVPMIVAHGTGQPDLDDLRRRCLAELAGYKRPRFLAKYGRPLPRTYSGKIMKQVLRAEFAHAPEDATALSYDA